MEYWLELYGKIYKDLRAAIKPRLKLLRHDPETTTPLPISCSSSLSAPSPTPISPGRTCVFGINRQEGDKIYAVAGDGPWRGNKGQE
jgi:hypothetical protein